MARALARLLGKDNILSRVAFDDLEKATGKKAIDTKLIGDILLHAHQIMRELGLDASDTTALELYNALRASKRMTFPSDAKYTAIFIGSECISFNKKDLAADSRKKVEFKDRSINNMRHELANEIQLRYRASANGKEVLVERLLQAIV